MPPFHLPSWPRWTGCCVARGLVLNPGRSGVFLHCLNPGPNWFPRRRHWIFVGATPLTTVFGVRRNRESGIFSHRQQIALPALSHDHPCGHTQGVLGRLSFADASLGHSPPRPAGRGGAPFAFPPVFKPAHKACGPPDEDCQLDPLVDYEAIGRLMSMAPDTALT